MKYEKSIENINKDGKQSVCLKLKDDVQKFLEILQEFDLLDYDFDTTVEKEALASLLINCIMVIDGQCCEGDYIVTTDENEKHDYEAFKDTILNHGWSDVTEGNLMKVWEKLAHLIDKELITWG